MKKFIFLFLGTVLFAGCKSAQPAVRTPSTSPVAVQEAPAGYEKIAAAMANGEPVSCTMKKNGETSAMTYVVKGKKMKISGMQTAAKTETGMMISDGTYFYSWETGAKQGIKMKVPNEQDLKEIANKNGQSIPTLKTEADKQKLESEGYSVDCHLTSIDDAEFSIPTDVKFADLSSMMEKTTQMMKQSSGSAQTLSPEEMQKQAAEMMKQYQK